MTALGLAVAIPAVLGYNALVRAHRLIHAELDAFAHDLHAYLATGVRLDAAVMPAEASTASR
jgi:biopolymer transport protein ExbB